MAANHPGFVDEDVQLAKLASHDLDGGGRRCFARHVECDRQCATARRPEQRGRLFGTRNVDVTDGHIRAFASQYPGNPPPDAARASSDQRNTFVEPSHNTPPGGVRGV